MRRLPGEDSGVLVGRGGVKPKVKTPGFRVHLRRLPRNTLGLFDSPARFGNSLVAQAPQFLEGQGNYVMLIVDHGAPPLRPKRSQPVSAV